MTLHAFIRKNHAAILATCEREMSERSPPLRDGEVLATMGPTLDDVIAALERDEVAAERSSPAVHMRRVGERSARLRHEIGAATLARDYGALCDAITTEALAHGLACSPREHQVLDRAIFDGVADALEEHSSRSRTAQENAGSERMGMLVHELRNALTSTTLAFGAMARGEQVPSSRSAAVLARGLRRMRDLVERTLFTVKLQSGVELERRYVRLVDVLRDAESAALLERGVSIRIDASDELEVDADPTLLLSAVSNLLGNALKFTRQGTSVVLRATAAEAGVVIEVEDRCGGLPAERRTELFDPFVQAGHDRRGVGLGLSIVREVVRAHGGDVRVRDLPGVGCIFGMTVPVRVSGVVRAVSRGDESRSRTG